MSTAPRHCMGIGLAALTLVATSATSAPRLSVVPLGSQIEFVIPVAGQPRALDIVARAGIVNLGDTAQAVTAQLEGTVPNAIVLDGSVSFGRVGLTSAQRPQRSGDTFKLRLVLPQSLPAADTANYVQATLQALSWQVSCGNCADNRPPVANAGADRTVWSSQTTTLDGSGSFDPDGDPLRFRWSLVSAPPRSAARISDSTVVRPTFVPDVEGTYVVQLIASDATSSSTPASVTVTTQNSAPVAHAGADQTAGANQRVQLNGARSTDVDGNALTYEWSLIEVPETSTAVLTNADPASPLADFSVDRPGRYVAQLVVRDADGTSTPDSTVISTANSSPVADAGLDQAAHVGESVLLTAEGSTDVDREALSYRWALTPTAGSGAQLSNQTGVNTGFTVDRAGTYVVQLVANDGTQDSEPDAVVISTLNSAPVAVASSRLNGVLGDVISLDGSASVDADGDAMTFSWTLLSAPLESAAAISSADTPVASFVPDVVGMYVAQLIVSDGQIDSAPSTTEVVVPIRDTGPLRLLDISPPNGSFSFSPFVLLTGRLSHFGTLRINDEEVSVEVDGTFQFNASLSPGPNGFDIEATDDVGGVATAHWILTQDSIAPTAVSESDVVVTAQADSMLAVVGAAGAAEPSASVRVTNARTGAEVTVTADASGAFFAPLAGEVGDRLVVTVIDAAQNESGATSVASNADTIPVRIDVSAPLNGVTVQGRTVVVTGTIDGPLDLGLSVAAHAASLYGEGRLRSFALPIDLVEGQNDIVLIATRPDGTTTERHLTVQSSGESMFDVTASASSGAAPLFVVFKIRRLIDTGDAVTGVEVDFAGDGEFELFMAGVEATPLQWYQTPGLYQAAFRITLASGVTLLYTVPITVYDQAQLDFQVTRSWNGMVRALYANDAAAALRYFHPDATAKYARVFADLAGDLPQVISEFSALSAVSVGESLAEYLVAVTHEGERHAYFVYFVKDGGGVWRLGSL